MPRVACSLKFVGLQLGRVRLDVERAGYLHDEWILEIVVTWHEDPVNDTVVIEVYAPESSDG